MLVIWTNSKTEVNALVTNQLIVKPILATRNADMLLNVIWVMYFHPMKTVPKTILAEQMLLCVLLYVITIKTKRVLDV